ncbi:MAG: NYN domain-containing protein [Pseudooceanicola sp.]|nr:NYN domain-containing protein [Pseudooceanicola sp.]
MESPTDSVQRLRVRVFVDFWNFSISLRNVDDSFRTRWEPIGYALAREAAKVVDLKAKFSFEGVHVYGSYDPNGNNDHAFKSWFTNVLDKMPGVHANLRPRQKIRSAPKCPSCKFAVEKCSSCGEDMRGTQEKGVDTAIVTDMIKLAWVDAYDVAVIVSADKDFVPVAEFLQTRGLKVIHAAFPPKGSQLSQKCWASFNVTSIMDEFRKHT